MKKFFSILTSLTILTLLTVSSASAVNFDLPEFNSVPIEETQESTDFQIPYVICDENENGMKKAGNPDLAALAKSLGADTDHYNFINYYGEGVSDEMFAKFVANLDQLDYTQAKAVRQAKECLKYGMCHSITVTEILAHNGIISPSDIQAGAKTLNDIMFDNDVNDKLCYYQMSQVFREQEMTMNNYFCNTDTKKQVKNLLDIAAKSMKNKKYFYFTLASENMSHAVVGIGLADGKWSYNGKNFDKCVLTLDSNTKTSKGTSAGFSENACIYVNSKTLEWYVPCYDIGQYPDFDFISYVCDNDALLNYKGLIKPSANSNTDISRIKGIEIINFEYDYDITINDGNNIKTQKNVKPKQHLTELCPNDLLLAPIPTEAVQTIYKNLDSIHIRTNSYDEDNLSDSYPSMRVQLESNSSVWSADSRYLFDLSIDSSHASVKNLYNESNFCCVTFYLNDTEYNADNYNSYIFEGDYDGTFSIKNTKDGILFETDKSFAGNIQAADLTSEMKNNKGQRFGLNANNNVMMKYDKTADEFYFCIGKNYDKRVEKGDVNCDGDINAIDASVLLADYARIQTKYTDTIYQPYNVTKSLADYNNDGSIDAIDASQILSAYANNQVK